MAGADIASNRTIFSPIKPNVRATAAITAAGRAINSATDGMTADRMFTVKGVAKGRVSDPISRRVVAETVTSRGDLAATRTGC